MKAFYNKAFKNYLLLMITLFLIEIVFRIVMKFNLLDWSLLRIFIGVNVISLILGTIYSFLGRIVGNILTFLTATVGAFYAILQAGFYNFVGTYMSFGTSTQVGAVKDYITDYFASFSNSFYLIFTPLLVLVIYYVFFEHKVKIMQNNETIDFSDKFDNDERKEMNEKIAKRDNKKKSISDRVSTIVMAIILAFVYYGTLSMPFMQNELQLKSNKELFSNPDLPNIAMGQFGPSAYAFIDLKSTLFPAPTPELETIYETTYEIQEQVISDYTRYVDDTIWKEIIEEEKNKNFKTLDNYFISQKITDKNDYTGLFKDKNLIVIMMESTNSIILNKEYFPNMYKLYTEGWSWDNAYSPRNACNTGNNEMSGMTSLYTINNLCTANSYKNNQYPQAIFNLFNKQGYTTSSYHNYTEQFYYRATIHPNMGSGHYYGVQELGIPYSNVYQEWPSDVELMEKFLDITESQDKYMAWITTVSAHQPYTVTSTLGKLYYDQFNDTKYNTSLKRYLSKLKVYDDAIGALIKGLKEQGKLDDTVIVMFADHYPYGLTTSTLNSYFTYDVTVNNEVDRTPFIIYNSKITPTKYTEYTTYMNIVPTIANLFDLTYDPRLYTGSDILSSDYDNRIIFADGSWQDEKAYYNATSGKVSYYQSSNTYTTDELKEINNIVKNRINMSNLAIKTNYFKDLFEKMESKKVSSNIEPVTE